MSKNYELLQQAALGAGVAPTFTTGTSSTASESVTPSIAEAARDLTSLEPQVREEALNLVQRLFLIPQEAPLRAVVFAAIEADIGCSWLCSVAAKLLAKSVPGSVCLVEGNLRSASLVNFLEIESDRGLVDSLRKDGPIRDFAKQLGPDNLWLLPAGASAQDFTVLLNSDRMKERIIELRKEFDYVIVNAPPLSAFADGMVLGRMADGVVLVLEANSTRREAAVRVTKNLRTTNIPVLGAVLNNRTFPIPLALYKRL